MDLTFVIASMLYLIPCTPAPEPLTPRNGKLSGPRWVLLLMWTVPTSSFSAISKAFLKSFVKTDD